MDILTFGNSTPPPADLTIKTVSGTSYTIIPGDERKVLVFNSSSPVAVTLPQAGFSFPSGWFCAVENIGSGLVTITPTVSTIDGASSISVAQYQASSVVSLGDNYISMPQAASIVPTSATAHQFVTSIASNGAATKAQPAFSDISGTVAASQLPTPGSTTLGGVKSLAASSHLFITGLGTDGVLTTAQPAFSDISGTASVGQIPSLPASQITSGLLALARGGTAVDLSASGGATAILAQDASHVISARNLVAADIPNISALKITSGLLALAQGGTGADLSATGGASQVLKQTSAGAAITVGQLAFTDLSGTASTSQVPNLSASKITSGQIALAQGGTAADLSATGGASQVLKQTSAGAAITVGQLSSSDISGLGTMATQNASSVTITGGTITGIGNPASANDVANKAYVDAVASGLSIRDSVVAATNGALPSNTYSNGSSGVGATLTASANGALTLDGYTVAANDRLLVKDEATASHNGIYTVTQTGDASHPYILTRATDTNQSSNLFSGIFVFVETGTVNTGAGFVLTTTGAITVGTTGLTFTQFSGAGEIIAGTGIVKSGNTISLGTPTTSSLGGIQAVSAVAHKWISSISTSGVPNLTQPAVADLSDGTTGSGLVVLATSPTLTTPTLGVASATSINKVAITAPATSATLTIADGKTLTVNNTLTFAGTDSTTLTFQGTGTVVNRDSTDTLTNKTFDTAGAGNVLKINGTSITAVTGSGSVVLATSPTLTTPSLGAATATSITGLTGAITPNAAGGTDIGSASLPFGNLYIGGAATNNIKITGTATAARTFTLPDADSNSVRPSSAGSHQFATGILSNGTIQYSQPSAGDLSDGLTGTGVVVLATSPSLTTPTLGAASATSINKVAITAPASSATLTILNGKTLTSNNTLTLAGTDSTTITFQGTDTYVGRATTDTLTHKTIDTAGTGNHIQIGGVDLPTSIGSSGQVLTNNGGVLAFTASGGGGSGSPGGTTGQIQYNTGTAFGGVSVLTPASTLVTGAAFISSVSHFTATGNGDLYTCPTGKRAIITEITVFNGHATNSSALVAMLKIGGVYYPATPSTNILAGTTGSRSVTYVLEAGETIAVNMTQQPFNVVLSIMEFDNTSTLKSAKLTTPTLTSGDNTIYTCPTGKSALVLNNTLTMCSGTIGTLSYGNASGGSITAHFNVVPSGGTVGSSNQMSSATSVSNGVGFAPTATSFSLGAGDFISVNLSAGTSDQIAFVTVVEI